MNKKILETLGKLGIQVAGAPLPIATNANEAMHSTNTNAGAELVPTQILAKEIFDAIPNYSTFLSMLPGFHGVGLGKSVEVDVIGDVGFFSLHTEKTGGAFALAAGSNKLYTDKITLTQKQLDLTVDVTNELSQFNVLGAEGLSNKLKEKIAKAMVRTVEAAIVNGDTTTAGTGNVNSDDGAPTAGTYYLGFDGLRKAAIADAAAKVNVGTFALDDLVSVANCLGDYFAVPEDCLWLFNRSTYNKALGIAEFADAAKNGKASTVNTGAITNILGADIVCNRDLPKTEADGKVSVTAANNTLGQFMCLWKPAVQYGFGQELQLQLFNMGKDGWQLQGWFNMAIAIVQKKGGVGDSSVGVGYNVTL